MDERTLRIFLSLCSTESTRDSAAVLSIDQSTVSRALGRLEHALGAQLFERRGRRLLLSPQGAGFRADAARILDAIESARRHALSDPGDDVVRLGFVPSVGRWLAPRVVASFCSSSRDARFDLRADFARELYRLVRDDVIDAALVTAPRTGEPHLEWQPLLDERLIVAVPRRHRLAGRRRVSVKELADERFIAFTNATELRPAVDAVLQRSGTTVRVIFETGELDTVRGLVAAGLGIAITPESATSPPDFVQIALTPSAARPIGIAWRAPGRRSAIAEAFLEHVRRPLLGAAST